MTSEEACRAASEYVFGERPRLHRAAYLHCVRRGFHGSRYDHYRSRIDGTKIHDRDRPWASDFYAAALAQRYLNPDECPWHRVEQIAQPRETRLLARNWNDIYRRPKMSVQRRARWMATSAGYEEFGSRGAIDLPASHFMRHVGDCFDPALMDNNYINAVAHHFRVEEICEGKRCTVDYIRSKWSAG